ncbi:MAG: DUF971 domain-containing protein [Oligoflexia bacterium]|nr:DUF971 domain-containing protein [Oligoflexia bacterium]
MQTPVEIRRLDSGLQIVWRDGNKTEIDSARLRQNCPCAECREKRGDSSHSSPLTPTKKSSLRVVEATREESLRLIKIWGVGNYALGIAWGDGHDSGIYTFEFLRTLPNLTESSSTPAKYS